VDDERPVAEFMCREPTTALNLDPFDPFCHLIKARSHLILHDIDTGMMHLETAKSLAPSFALAYSGLASIQAMSGKPELALQNMETAMRLSPQDPWKVHMQTVMVAANNALEQHEEAMVWARKVLESPQRTLQNVGGMMITMHHGGQKEEAEKLAQEFRRRYPGKNRESFIRSYPVISEKQIKMTEEGFEALGIS
jgi:Tfp pilus assembly protein PilF